MIADILIVLLLAVAVFFALREDHKGQEGGHWLLRGELQ